MRERLAYLHLPKAAGTSIRSAFAAYYPPEVTVPYSFDRHLFGDESRIDEITEPVFLGDPADFRSHRYMEGHWTLPSMRAAFDAADVVCVLREPRARLLSHYTFWRSWPESMHALWEPYRAARFAQLPLSAYCVEPQVAHQADNLVARLVLGPHELIPDRGFIRSDDVGEVVAAACAQLDAIGHTDVLERGDAMYRDLETWFGSPLERAHLNETDLADGSPVDLDDLLDGDTLELVNRRTSADREIWRHVAAGYLVDDEATTLADREFERAVRRIVGLAGGDPDAVRLPSTPWRTSPSTSTSNRFAALLRRGPRAVWQRTVAEVEQRRRARRS